MSRSQNNEEEEKEKEKKEKLGNEKKDTEDGNVGKNVNESEESKRKHKNDENDNAQILIKNLLDKLQECSANMITKAEELEVHVIIQNEAYTSKTWSWCGNIRNFLEIMQEILCFPSILLFPSSYGISFSVCTRDIGVNRIQAYYLNNPHLSVSCAGRMESKMRNEDSKKDQVLSHVLQTINAVKENVKLPDELEEILELPPGLKRPLTREDVKNELEARFLVPQPTFPKSWLPKCQQNWERDPNYFSFLTLQPSKPRTTIELVRDGVDETTLTAKNSTSLLREPSAPGDFVKGRSNYFPFAPGGLESEVLIHTAEDVTKVLEESFKLEEDGLLTIPPGFERGLLFEGEGLNTDAGTGNFVTGLNIADILTHDEDYLEFLEPIQINASQENIIESTDVDVISETVIIQPSITEAEATMDSFLPTQAPPLLGASLVKRSAGIPKKREWAHIVDVNTELSNFKELVPEMAFQYPFELDTFQKQAVYHLENGDSVFVAAHTSAGKTVVAEYAIALASKHMTRAIYTSPIKALSNQKYRDFKKTFSGDVGILTGDVQISPEASCLIMTTEILRSMLYKGADLIRDVEFVVFDEVHYVNDSERGVVWEEVIIMLPAHVNLILLSATVPNTQEFADWVGRTKKKDIYVISTAKRPVPLEHYLYAEKEIYKIVDAKNQFLNTGWKQANDALTKKEKESKPANVRGGRGATGSRGASRGGRGAPYRGGGNGSYRTMIHQDRNLWSHLIGFLNKKKLLPVVIFTFSKKKCDEYAHGLTNVDLNTATEKSQIHIFIEKSLTRLKGTDKELPQVVKTRELLSRGIAVHHGGLLPIIKEMVEILFGIGLVKVLFATETFAMGVNMPAKTVVFSSTRKHDGKSFRELLPGEYTQMSGRAGRRGLDATGMVIIACSGEQAPDTPTLDKMIRGKPTKLESQFRLTYNMILNLLRVEALRVEEMIKRSFSENTGQKMLPDYQKMFAEKKKSLDAFQTLDCTICNIDINQYYDVSFRILDLNRALLRKIVSTPTGIKAISPGRVVIINNVFYRNTPAIILKSSSTGAKHGVAPAAALAGAMVDSTDRKFFVLILLDKRIKVPTEDIINLDGMAPLPVTRVKIPDQSSAIHYITDINSNDIAIVTKTTIKFDFELVFEKREEAEIHKVVQKLLRYAIETQTVGIIENDWSKIKELEFQTQWKEKITLMSKLDHYQCTKCPDLNEHYGMIHGERLLKLKVEELRHTISDQNLELLPDYEQRMAVLRQLNYIDQNGTVQLKGRVACEINSADELIITELILDNILGDFEPEEIVALLSCFLFQERKISEPTLTSHLEKGKKIILDVAQHVGEIQSKCGLPIGSEDYVRGLNFGLVEVVYEWARGMTFKDIMQLTDVLEGSIVRCITRLDETCREIRNAARIIGDSSLYKKMEDAQGLIKRDIVFAASLYF
ncbi:hypothetical protein G9A89_007409 [Geosiphon pyriformis]|nr:hypothetical protein G9A89_007409 [Geosiphon pyriformis]